MDAEASAEPREGKKSGNTSCAVCSKELPVTFALWYGADHESLELSCAAYTGAADRRHCGREYSGHKAKCLCGAYQCSA